MANRGFYEVDRIIAKRRRSNNRVEYLVRWKGYSKSSDTWEPLVNLHTCMDVVHNFNAAKKRTRATSTKQVIETPKKSKRKRRRSQSTVKFNSNNESRKEKRTQSPTHNGKTTAISSKRNTTENRPKHSEHRSTSVFVNKKTKLLYDSHAKRGRSFSPANLKSRQRNFAKAINIFDDSTKSNSFLPVARKVEFPDSGGLSRNGYFHTMPPSTDHEYFSLTYFCPPIEDTRESSPNTSDSDENEVSEVTNEDGNVIIESRPTEVPCNSGYSIQSAREEDDDGKSSDSFTSVDVDLVSERKMTLRGVLSRSKHLHILRRGNCTEIILSNEKDKNYLTLEILKELSRLLESAGTDTSSVILFSSVGDYFCSGLDVKCLVHKLTSASKIHTVAKHCASVIRNFINILIDFPKPLVTIVQGPAIGLGCSMLPLFDTVYSSDRAYFTTPYTEMGQTPDGCSSYLFPQILGQTTANDMLLNGTTLTAIEAKTVGLVSDVYLHDSLKRNVLPTIKSLSMKSQKVLISTKELIRNSQRSKLKYINQCEYVSLKERWSDRETLKYLFQFLSPYHHPINY